MRFPVRVFDYDMVDGFDQPLEYKFKTNKLLAEEIKLERAVGWSEFKPSIRRMFPETYPFKMLEDRGRFVRFEVVIENKSFFLTFCGTHSRGWVLFTPMDLKAVFKKVYASSKDIIKDITEEERVLQKLRFTVCAVMKYMFEHAYGDYIQFSTSKVSAANNFKLALKSMETDGFLTIEEKVSHKTKSFYLCKEEETVSVLRRLYLDFERKHATSSVSTDPIAAS